MIPWGMNAMGFTITCHEVFAIWAMVLIEGIETVNMLILLLVH
jgi:hypothetical protein